MKLIIQIPCFNESQTLPATLAALPRRIEGIDCIETLIVDDGSTDGTDLVARQCGVNHVVRFTSNRGLARGFAAGLDACLRLGADIIVNTDADGQYPGEDIARLVAPILHGEADLVVGDRGVDSVSHFSPIKRVLQRFGSNTVSMLSGIDVGDVTSGFRAYSREAALRLNIITNFTYTLETIMQSGEKPITIVTVPTSSNPPTRPSRLFSGIGQYLRRQIPTILRLYLVYQPLKTFTLLCDFSTFTSLGQAPVTSSPSSWRRSCSLSVFRSLSLVLWRTCSRRTVGCWKMPSIACARSS
jgi:glycosyltransferase involved in cell wall biosynthesis